jgi:membrane fusion protein (multidrug efflux system)
MRKKLVTSLLILILCLTGCTNKEESTTEKPPAKTTKNVEIYRLYTDKADLSFYTTGNIEAKNKATVISEISGKITNIEVKIGDEIEENQLIAKIGDSLSTDNITTQYETALKNLELTKVSTNLNIENANNNTELAKISYENSISNKYDVIRNYEIQLESLYHQLDQAEETYKDAKDYYKDNKDDLDDISKENAKQAKKNAKYQVEQIELSIESFKANYYTQVDQVEYSIDSTKNQYQASITQLDLIKTSSESQILTAKNNLKIAENNINKTNICAPIKGQISNIYFKENDFINSGTAIIEIENLETLIVKTSINDEEKSLINIGEKVYIESGSKSAEGEITSINPTANPLTQKFDVEIQITDSDFVSGQNIQIKFIGNSKERIFIPSNSIYLKANKEYVYVLDQKNTVHKKEVITGNIIGEYIEVLNGLSGDERIINSNTYSLEENELINIANPVKIKRN